MRISNKELDGSATTVGTHMGLLSYHFNIRIVFKKGDVQDNPSIQGIEITT